MATIDEEYGGTVQDFIRLLIEDESARPHYTKQSHASICRVPDSLRNLNPTAYTPRIISIGPLHRHDRCLRDMKEQKVTYMYRLFCRTSISTNKDMKQITRECVQAMLLHVTSARACYAPRFTSIDDFQLAEMMVIDGCFILELFYRYHRDKYHRVDRHRGRILESDPISDNKLVMHGVRCDLLLLENQIPFFVLEKLFSYTLTHISESTSLTDFVFCFFKDFNFVEKREFGIADEKTEHCHVLGLLQSSYKPTASSKLESDLNISYSACEIARAGVKLKGNTEDCLLPVKFEPSSLFVRDASFKIPVLCINNSTPLFLRNLIAYEQCYPSSHPYVTSFAFLMDKLIDTRDDVSLLTTSKVLKHNLGASEYVTHLFNNICKGVVVKDSYYSNEWKQLDAYCNHVWPSILIILKRLYRTTTWKTLTIIAAMMIFVLTLLQTIYTVGDIHH